MADECDMSDGINEASRAVAQMPEGEPGECSGCGEFFSRTGAGYCGLCRDKYARYMK